MRVLGGVFRACLSSCPLVAGGRGFRGPGPAGGWLWSSGRVFPPFCPLSRFVFGALALNMALFRILRAFLRGFRARMYIRMGRGLCVACGAFVRVWS